MTMMKGTIKSWSDRSTNAKSQYEQSTFQELLGHVKVDELDLVDESPDSEIANFYNDKSVLITGGSGFVGKSIVEKLLRSCPNIKEIFILIRPKRGVDIETRIKLMLHLSLFDRIRNKPNGGHLLSTKIKPIKGDISLPLLGLSDEDMEYVCSRVDIIINSAATVRFDEPIEKATLLNVISLDTLLNLGLRMPKLKSIVHISTCYAHCNRHTIEERFYDPPIDPEELISLMNRSANKDEDKQRLDSLVANAKRPNTYTLTKAIAETLLMRRSKEFPNEVSICIVRPSIVCASWREPLRGWIDNQFAATGIIAGLASGSTSVFCSKKLAASDIIPVDMIANSIITSAWAICRYKDKFPNVTIFNVASGMINRVDWGTVVKEFNELANKFPYDTSVRPPGSLFVSNKLMYYLLEKFDSMSAAKYQLICDILGIETTLWFGHKAARKRHQLLNYFTTREWKFQSVKASALRDQMNPVDKDIFQFSPSEINWKQYFHSYYVGTKMFTFKDNPDKLLASRRRVRSFLKFREIFSHLMIAVFIFMLSIYTYRNIYASG